MTIACKVYTLQSLTGTFQKDSGVYLNQPGTTLDRSGLALEHLQKLFDHSGTAPVRPVALSSRMVTFQDRFHSSPINCHP